MPEYEALRAEIIANHTFASWATLICAVIILAGAWLIADRPSPVAVFLPLFTIGWAAAMVRVDFLIHRAGAYIRTLEQAVSPGGGWETWRQGLRATPVLIPATDALIVLPIIVPTLYLAFGPARLLLSQSQYRFASAYPWAVCGILALLLASLLVVPRLSTIR